jgi:hypothetical protein
VENWNNPPQHGTGCPGEDIWDHGRDILKGAGKDATWGMAINPVNRRGQHQVGFNRVYQCWQLHFANKISWAISYIKPDAQLFYAMGDCKQ